MVGFAGLAIISEVAEKKAFEAADRVRYRVTLLASIVICLAFLLGYLYSDSIVWPIQLLVKATQKVAQGNFQVKLKPKTNDELALRFNAFLRISGVTFLWALEYGFISCLFEVEKPISFP
jgi:nitrogen fixation/metabolism regulation signal transduction histidine kinase